MAVLFRAIGCSLSDHCRYQDCSRSPSSLSERSQGGAKIGRASRGLTSLITGGGHIWPYDSRAWTCGKDLLLDLFEVKGQTEVLHVRRVPSFVGLPQPQHPTKDVLSQQTRDLIRNPSLIFARDTYLVVLGLDFQLTTSPRVSLGEQSKPWLRCMMHQRELPICHPNMSTRYVVGDGSFDKRLLALMYKRKLSEM